MAEEPAAANAPRQPLDAGSPIPWDIVMALDPMDDKQLPAAVDEALLHGKPTVC